MSLTEPQRRALLAVSRGRDTAGRIADRCQMTPQILPIVINALMRRGLITAVDARYEGVERYALTDRGRRKIG